MIGACLIAFAVLLVTGARLGQTYGYRRLFTTAFAHVSAGFAAVAAGAAATAWRATHSVARARYSGDRLPRG